MSSLGRLFEYAKVSTVDVRENYTTQALAEAIQSDPGPIVLALSRAGILGIDATVGWTAEVSTQWSFPDVTAGLNAPDRALSLDSDGFLRFVDLIVLLESATRTCEAWIEVKTGSGIHGDQLESYRRYIDAHQVELERDLVLLAPEPLKTNVPLTQLRWQDITDAVRRSRTTSAWWLDLVTYLEEIQMSERWTLPVSAREAVALEDAHHLFLKAYGVMKEVNARIVAGAPTPSGRRFPKFFGWPDAWTQRTCLGQFQRHGRVMLWNQGGRPVATFYGYAPLDGETRMAVWIEADPRRTADRQRVREWAKTRLSDWERPGDGWQLVVKSARAILVETTEDAVTWFLGALGEIVDAGLYEDIYPDETATEAPIESEPDLVEADEAVTV